MFEGEVVIYADGGCENNGAENATAYGSYLLMAVNGETLISQKHSGRIDYPRHQTNNAAEVQVFIDACNALLAKANGERIPYKVTYYTDSQLAVNWITGNWRVNADHIKPLVSTARSIMCRFDQFEIAHVGREVIVDLLGH